MPSINWQARRVSSNTRWAIYDETFPAILDEALADHPDAYDAFDQEAAVDVLLAVAGAWPTLGRDRSDLLEGSTTAVRISHYMGEVFGLTP